MVFDDEGIFTHRHQYQSNSYLSNLMVTKSNALDLPEAEGHGDEHVQPITENVKTRLSNQGD